MDRPVTQVDPLPPLPVPFEGARVQRDRHRSLRNHCRMPRLQCDQIWKASTSSLCRVRIEECLKTTPEGAERLDRRSEVLNEALAKEVERNVRRREEVGNTARALAVPRELKNVPIPPISDPRKGRTMNAATAVASSGRSQMESSRAVADESRLDVEGEERGEFRSSTEPNTRRRIVTKTSLEENKSDENSGSNQPRVVRWDP